MAKNKPIVAFCCENSAYKAADSITDPDILDLVEIVRLPCSGKIEITHVLRSLEEDYKGVLILGCPVDNCKFIQGNIRAKKRIQSAKDYAQAAGVDPIRIRIDFISSVDHAKFSRIIKEMDGQLSAITV